MFSRPKKCPVCAKEIGDNEGQKFNDLLFCGQTCQDKYQSDLDKLNKEMTLDDCC